VATPLSSLIHVTNPSNWLLHHVKGEPTNPKSLKPQKIQGCSEFYHLSFSSINTSYFFLRLTQHQGRSIRRHKCFSSAHECSRLADIVPIGRSWIYTQKDQNWKDRTNIGMFASTCLKITKCLSYVQGSCSRTLSRSQTSLKTKKSLLSPVSLILNSFWVH